MQTAAAAWSAGSSCCVADQELRVSRFLGLGGVKVFPFKVWTFQMRVWAMVGFSGRTIMRCRELGIEAVFQLWSSVSGLSRGLQSESLAGARMIR